MNGHNLYVLPQGEECIEFIEHMFDNVILVKKVEDVYRITKKDVILYGGGEDISPSLYNQKPCKYTTAPRKPSARDLFEREIFKIGNKHLGICRGAQFLCAMSGGSLYQHVTWHGSDHIMFFTKNSPDYRSPIQINSTHHQMMCIDGLLQAELIGFAHGISSFCYKYEEEVLKKTVPDKEPEIVFFHNTNALAIQGHPEYDNAPAGFPKVCRQLIEEYLLK